jgi:hypothetical protein
VNAVFECKDFREMRDAPLGHVTMLDVLLYVNPEMQRELLARAAEFVCPDRGSSLYGLGLATALGGTGSLIGWIEWRNG